MQLNLDGVERESLHAFTERAYLNYSMYVIMDRALPHLTDGLKPVQRRIIYAMSELGLSAGAKYKKSARTVGDVLGKYHPHGDSACYEAMVLMAQPFSYRYPLVDGQGNWGACDDPKSFAAMRYTEARLSKFAQLLLSELEQGTVEWGPNFDGTLQEPLFLPARLPHILLNGASGIAVGLSTDIPPHNAREVAQACVALLDDPSLSHTDLMQWIQGPDYPSAAEIVTSKQELLAMYQTGRGSIRARCVYQIEEGEIVITALPAQVASAKIFEQIAAQMESKKLTLISDLRDESDQDNPTRLVIVPRSGRVDFDSLMAHLFATTDLEKSYRTNFNMVGLDRRPAVKDLKTILQEWLSFRLETTRRKLQYQLDKVEDRLHVLAGFLVAFLNIEDVISIIRELDEPKTELMRRFDLSERQANAILDLRLRQIARLEEHKIQAEHDKLAKERSRLQQLLSSPKRLKTFVKKELLADAQLYGDERRSQLKERGQAQVLSEKRIRASDPITVIVSKQGWVRAAKGTDIDPSLLNYKAGDGYLTSVASRTDQSVVLLTNQGRTYKLDCHTLPSARTHGEPLTGRFHFSPDEQVQFLLAGENDQQFLLATDAGYGFICFFSTLQSRNKNGKAVLSIPPHASILPPRLCLGGGQSLFCLGLSQQGRMLLFRLDSVPTLSKGKGSKLMNISAGQFALSEDRLAFVQLLGAGQGIQLSSGKRKLRLTADDLMRYQGERGRRGILLPRNLQHVDAIELF